MNKLWRCGCLLLLLAGCANREAAFRNAYEAAAGRAAGEALLGELLLLDQKYPGRLQLKVDIGAALLAAGDHEKAGIYLESGRALAARSRDQRLRARLHAALSEYCYRSGRLREAIAYADKALAGPGARPAEALLIRARARRASGKTQEALEDYARAWPEAGGALDPQDFRAYSELLIAAGRYAEALAVYDEYQQRFPYETGIGLGESLLYEKLGKIEESIAAAFKELEYQRYGGGVSDALLLDNLQELSRKLEDRQWNPEAKGGALVEALKRYVRGQWERAAAGLQTAGPVLDLPFGRYLLLSARLEAGRAAEEDFQDYRLLEPYLKSLPAYYFHLWRGMRRGPGAYSAAAARPVLEKCILLAPHTSFASDSREELGRLLGLAPADGARLLLGPELQAIGLQVAAGGDLARLVPVLELLATPDNEYQLAAMLLLKQLASREQVRLFLAERARSAAGRLKERLSFVLSG